MKSYQLETALRSHPETKEAFLGVFASDELPTTVNMDDVALIANTDPSHMPGQHWCAFYVTADCVYYFDPYGLPPLVKSFDTLMRCRKKSLVFPRRLQGSGTVCGHYCLYFILAMARKDADVMMDKFGQHLDANDRLVRMETLRHFRV